MSQLTASCARSTARRGTAQRGADSRWREKPAAEEAEARRCCPRQWLTKRAYKQAGPSCQRHSRLPFPASVTSTSSKMAKKTAPDYSVSRRACLRVRYALLPEFLTASHRAPDSHGVVCQGAQPGRPGEALQDDAYGPQGAEAHEAACFEKQTFCRRRRGLTAPPPHRAGRPGAPQHHHLQGPQEGGQEVGGAVSAVLHSGREN